jgi:integrase
MKSKSWQFLKPDELSNTNVSYISKWSDYRWILVNNTPGQVKIIIIWSFDMPDGSKFTDPQWTDMLESCRRIIWSIIILDTNGSAGNNTLSTFSYSMRYFIRWMCSNDYQNFGELDDEAFNNFLTSAKADKANNSTESVSYGSIRMALSFPITMWKRRSVLERAGLPVPKSAPFNGAGMGTTASEIAKKEYGTIPPMPDQMFQRATDLAISNIKTNMNDDTVNFVDALYNSRSLEKAKYYILRQKNQSLPNRIHVVSKALSIRDSCVTILQGLTGMRGNEICGITTKGIDPDTGFPDCIIIRQSASGLDEIFYIRSLLSKTVRTPVQTDWLIGARPIGSGDNAVPLPVQAVCVLERLFRNWRTTDGFSDLVMTLNLRGNASPYTVQAMNFNLKKYFDADEILKAHEPSTHQWRKAFAQYVIRSDSSMLPALKDHFKHLSIAMTEQGYVAADPEMLQLLDDAAVQNTVSMIGAMMSGKSRHKGPMADEISETAKKLGVSLDNRNTEEKRADIEEMVRSSGMRSWEVRYNSQSLGECMFRPGTGKCMDGCPAKWVMRAPLWSAARPDLCWECRNLVVADDTHLEYWQERLATQRMIISNAGNEDFALAMLARQRAAQCITVLHKMGWKDEAVMETINAT